MSGLRCTITLLLPMCCSINRTQRTYYTLLRSSGRQWTEHTPGSLERQMNRIMAAPRTVASEHMYGVITNLFQWVDFTRWQRLFWTKPAEQYLCAVLFTNMMSCLRGRNKVSQWFRYNKLPSLRNYLRGHWSGTPPASVDHDPPGTAKPLFRS